MSEAEDCPGVVNLDDLEHVLRSRLDTPGPAPRAELLHVLMLPDYERSGRIGEFYRNPNDERFAQLLTDAEEDPYLRRCSSGSCGSRTSPPDRPTLEPRGHDFDPDAAVTPGTHAATTVSVTSGRKGRLGEGDG